MMNRDCSAHLDLAVELGPLHLKNPIITASGTCGFGKEYASFFDLAAIGALTTKTITATAREGNPPPRLAESPAGLINSIGLANPGLNAFLKEHLPFLAACGTPFIVSIAGSAMDEYVKIASRLDREASIAALEVNVSCPNVDLGGAMISARPDLVCELAQRLRQVTSHPLLFKLSPQIGTVVEAAEAARTGGADVLCLVNTFPALAVDAEARRPVLGGTVGGLSGPAIKPLALRIVWDVAQRVQVPIIGGGGICTAKDVAAFALAGASAVFVGTAGLLDPCVCAQLVVDLRAYLQQQGIPRFADLIGKLEAG